MPIKKRLKVSKLQGALREAACYDDWRQAANSLDEMTGADRWRMKEDSNLYDSRQIRIRHDRLIEVIGGADRQELLYTLNEGIHGNMGGMGKDELYQHSLIGTKELIQDYIEVLCKALREVADAPEAEVPFEQKLDFFRRASHCYGRSALSLSGGGGLIYFHHGVVDTLTNEGLLPNIISGASAGSWMCVQLGARTDKELEGYFSNKRYELSAAHSNLKLLAGMDQDMARVNRDNAIDSLSVGDMTFQEAYEHTGRYINISIAPFERHQRSRLMNALTSPNVTIASAARASSSVPGLVGPVQLEAKDSRGNIKPYLRGRYWVDGSFSEDLPFKRLSRLFGVNHYIVSMINPLAIPFLSHIKHTDQGSLAQWLVEMLAVTTRHGIQAAKRWGNPLTPSGVDSILSTLYQVLDQSYVGDINVVFDYRKANLDNALFKYRSEEHIQKVILEGRRAIWPKLCQIKNSVTISKLIDEILEDLEQDMVASPHETRLAHITR